MRKLRRKSGLQLSPTNATGAARNSSSSRSNTDACCHDMRNRKSKFAACEDGDAERRVVKEMFARECKIRKPKSYTAVSVRTRKDAGKDAGTAVNALAGAQEAESHVRWTGQRVDTICFSGTEGKYCHAILRTDY